MVDRDAGEPGQHIGVVNRFAATSAVHVQQPDLVDVGAEPGSAARTRSVNPPSTVRSAAAGSVVAPTVPSRAGTGFALAPLEFT